MNDELSQEIEKAKEEVLVAIARLEKLTSESVIVNNRSIEAMRSQNSAEHGSLFSKLEFIATSVHWLKKQWEKFTKS
jgi:hypothetical protein